MKDFWNTLFAEKEYAYGKDPNNYFKTQLKKLPPGKILMAAEGEGRNAVYAACLGWEVYAYDFSEEAHKKAMALAREKGVSVAYQLGSLEDLDFDLGFFDAIGLIYVHFPDMIRTQNHHKLISFLAPKGHIILEGFSTRHPQYQALNPRVGGPKLPEQLYSVEKLEHDFKSLNILQLEEQLVALAEGYCHVGETTVMRMLAKKR